MIRSRSSDPTATCRAHPNVRSASRFQAVISRARLSRRTPHAPPRASPRCRTGCRCVQLRLSSRLSLVCLRDLLLALYKTSAALDPCARRAFEPPVLPAAAVPARPPVGADRERSAHAPRREIDGAHAVHRQAGDRRSISASPIVRCRRNRRASRACEPTAGRSLARWRTTKTSIGSAMSAARRRSSSSWRSRSPEGSGRPQTTA